MPKLYGQIDWTIAPIFLEQEFQSVLAETFKDKKKSVDKLAKVALKNGKIQWILLHLEIQSYFETDFAKRVFIYYNLITQKYGDLDLTTFVVYTGQKIPKVFDKYERSCFGTTLTYQFNAYKVRDQKEQALIQDENPFALAILACLYLIKTKKDINQRFTYKRQLIQLAYERGLKRFEIISLLRFIKKIVQLPKLLEQDFTNKVLKALNINDMYTVTDEDKYFINGIYKVFYGESLDDYLKKIELEAEQGRIKAEQGRIKAEQERIKAIKKMLQMENLTIEQIADIYEISIEDVLEIKNKMNKQ